MINVLLAFEKQNEKSSVAHKKKGGTGGAFIKMEESSRSPLVHPESLRKDQPSLRLSLPALTNLQ